MESLKSFPSNKKSKGFDPDNYGAYVHLPVFTSHQKGEIGIELEMEGSRILTNPTTRVNGVYWTRHAEGSLRGESSEYVLSAPCMREDVRALLEGLYGEFRAHGTVLDLSSRCSTHVHINASGLKVHQLASYVILWGILEDVLVNWCGEKRAGNLFCLRLSDCSDAPETWAKAFKSGRFSFQENLRYLALNAHALNKFGSLEFRTLRGADEPELVIKWVDCLLRLKDLATTRFADPRDIATEFSGLGPVDFLKDVLSGLPILDELFVENDKMGTDVIRALWDGLRRIQPIIYCLPWSEVIEESGKERIINPFKTKKQPTGARVNLDWNAIRARPPVDPEEDDEDFEEEED